MREAQQLRHADRVPKIQLLLSMGERVPVRYDTADRDPDPQCQFCHQPVPVQPPA